MNGAKLSGLYDGKRIEWMGLECASELDLKVWDWDRNGNGNGTVGWGMANLGSTVSPGLCKVWICRFCKSYYYYSSNRRKFIMGLLRMREIADRDCEYPLFDLGTLHLY
jgi:hypothetical protein